MSRRGNCYGNVVIESWFSTVKSEEGERFESYAHAKEALFDYIDVFDSQRRRHSTLGQTCPAEFERSAGCAAQLVRPPRRIMPTRGVVLSRRQFHVRQHLIDLR